MSGGYSLVNAGAFVRLMAVVQEKRQEKREHDRHQHSAG